MTTSRSARYSHARQGATAIDAEIAKSLATIEAARVARAVEVKAARQAEKDRHRFTREEILLASFVLTSWNVWERVVTVNKVTVTVLDPYYGHKVTIKFSEILAVKA